MYDSSRSGVDRAAEHVGEQQHQRDRRDRRGDDRVGAAHDVGQRSAGEDTGVAEDVGGHRDSFRAGTHRRSGLTRWFRSRRCRRRVRGRPPRGRAASRRTRPCRPGSSCFSSARVPFWMIVPLCRIAIRSASCSASSRCCVVSSTVVPLSASSLDGLPHLEARLRVESGRRLVEEDDRRAADQAHRDVEPAAHAAGVGRRLAAPCLGEREAGEQVVGDRSGILQVPQLRDQHEVLTAGEHLVDGGELAGQADRLAHVARVRGDVEAVDRRGARVGLQQRRQDADQCGLARPVRAEQGEDAAPGHLEVDAPQHVQVLE